MKLVGVGLSLGYILSLMLVALLYTLGIQHPEIILGDITGYVLVDSLLIALMLAILETFFVIPFAVLGLYLYSKMFTVSITLIDAVEKN